ncbi:MAG: hypothetical protein H6811_09615 [Phycisphaeraceae bacterium]|nr:hypothetical protein [Phycisphaeraceae bacterium]
MSRLLGIGVLVLGVYLILIHPAAPIPRLVRAFTESPRCLICNRAATVEVRYGPDAARGGGFPHRFCPRHPPPKKLWHTIWPEVDKYAFMLLAIGAMGGGIGLALGAIAIGGFELVSSAGGMIAFGFVANNLMMWIN